MLIPESGPEDGPGESGGQRRRDLQLATPHPAAELDRRLVSTYRLANSFIQEQGVNTLFLALGMLRWRDGGANQETRLAPLVLLPVSLERVNLRGRFRLRHTGDDPESNVSLREKLRLEFGVALPELPEADSLDTGAYFDSVAEAVHGLDGWTVDSEQIALGFFSFSKFLMYRDLDVETWPGDASPAEHPIIGALLEDGFDEPPPFVDDDDNLDSVLAPGDTYQVVDADGSQTLTLLDVNQGLNMVVQGPPGTGKSQTITNMIAEAVGHGRTVLFVSEKMAALEVVKRRLDNVGLGDACLELHSHKTAKRVVLDELSRTLDLGPRHPKGGGLREAKIALISLRGVARIDRESDGRPHRRTHGPIGQEARRSPAHVVLPIEGDVRWEAAVGPGYPVQFVGTGRDPARYSRHLAVLLTNGPPDVRVSHGGWQIHGEDPPFVPGEKDRGLHAVELRGLDEIVLSNRDV